MDASPEKLLRRISRFDDLIFFCDGVDIEVQSHGSKIDGVAARRMGGGKLRVRLVSEFGYNRRMNVIESSNGPSGEKWLAHCVFFGAGSDVVVWMQSMRSQLALEDCFDWVRQSVDEFERCLLDVASPKRAAKASPLLYSSTTGGESIHGFPGRLGFHWLGTRCGEAVWSNWKGVDEAAKRLSDRLAKSSLNCHQACGPINAGMDLSNGPTPWPSSDCMEWARKCCESRAQAREIDAAVGAVGAKRKMGGRI